MSENKYVQEIFRYLHSIPEIGLTEIQTSKFIAEELRKFGYDVTEKIGGTGVVAKMESGIEGPILAVRADMDALEFSIDGEIVNIHACGHDAHSSIVLAVAKSISESGIEIGKILFVFQQAEELGKGAKLISESKILDEVDEMVGIHLRPIQEAKLGEATPALYHGASKMVTAEICGLASHGARPHLGVNAIDAAAIAINSINAIRIDPRVPHSAKVTKINSTGSAHNIIPDKVIIALDLRAQNNETMDTLTEAVEKAIIQSAKSIGAEAKVNVEAGLPAAEYDADMIKIAKEAIEEVLGEALDPIITPGGEDFHYYTKMLGVKTAYVGLGANLTPGLHNPKMSFDLKTLEYGEEILIKIIKKRLM
ncbi:amidohydrolase [Clostridium sp. DL1XJH146]